MKGATSRRRHRPTENAEYMSQEHILHSTAINENSPPFAPNTPGFEMTPIVITAPTGFPNFTAVLQRQGFFVAQPRNHLQVDQLMFRQALCRFLRTSKAQERTTFVKEAERYLSVPENLCHSMTSTLHPDEVLQESLLQSFLNIPELHKIAIDALLPAIMDLVCIVSDGDEEELDRLEAMLTQLRWIEYPSLDAFISFLIGTIESATSPAKLIILQFLPDIIPDHQHSKLLMTLKELLETADSPIISAIMECLSSLDISSAEWAENRAYALTQLLNAPLNDFPAYFGFLLKTEDISILSEVITELRENLELVPLGGNATKNATSLMKIVDKIRFCISVNSQLVPTWVKLVTEDIENGDDNRIKPLDLSMILIFIESFKTAVTALRLICLIPNLIVKLLDFVILHNMPILSEVYQTLVKFCDSILWSSKDLKAQSGVKQVLVTLFIALDQLQTRDIGSNLICAVMNGDNAARAMALRIFNEIRTKKPAKLLPFAQQLMGILQVNNTVPTQQIRELMQVLATMGHIEGCVDSERFGTEYTILLRKYLTDSNIQNRCLGVIGSLATVRELAKSDAEQNEFRIHELLNLAWSCVKREEDACRLFFDELSNITESLPKGIFNEFRTLMQQSFLDSWCQPADQPTALDKIQNKQCHLQLTEQFVVELEFTEEEDDPEGIGRNIISFEEKPLGMSPLGIPAHTRLLFQLTSRKSHMKSLLASSLYFPDINIYFRNPGTIEISTLGQRRALGSYLLLAINFFRESISALVDERDEFTQILIWFRLSNIISLQQFLVQNIQHLPVLPVAYVNDRKMIGSECNGGGLPVLSGFKRKTADGSSKNKRKKGNKKNKDGGDNETETQVDLSNSAVLSVQPPEIRSLLRKLEPATFKLLAQPLSLSGPNNFDRVWQKLRDRTSTAKDILASVKHLYPEALSLLLLEINQRSGNPENGFNLLDVEDLVQCVAKHLKTIVDEFENSSQLRGVRKFEECIQLILTTMSTYFDNVGKLTDSVQRENYYDAILRGLTATADIDGQATEGEHIEAAVSFLKKVSVCIRKSGRALDHIKAVNSFQTLFPENEVASTAVVHIAETYMNSNWKLTSLQVDFMLKARVLKSTEPMNVMRTITNSIIQPDHGDLSGCYPGNLHSFYSVLFQLLSQHVAKNGKRATASGDGIKFWRETVVMFKDLVFVSETHRQLNILSPLLKHSRTFIESYTAAGTILLPTIYEDNLNEFKHLVRNLQNATRKLQIICEHSKVQKNTKLMRNVPLLKRALESLVFRVRELFTVNKISNAFWLGSLRHKTMDGEEFSSQPFNQSDRNSNSIVEDDDDTGLEQDGETDESAPVAEPSDSDSEELEI